MNGFFDVLSISSLLQAIPSLKILVLGDGMLDHYVWGEVHRISPEAPIPVVAIERDTYRLGGACNVALNLQQLGAQVTFLGAIGKDEAGHTLQQLLHQHQITCDDANFSSQISTIVKTRVIAQHQQICRLDRETPLSAEQAAAFTKRVEAWVQKQSFSAIVVSDYAKGSVTQPLLDQLVQHKQQSSFFLAMDPKPKNSLCYRGIDLLKPNRQEALQLAKIDAGPRESFPLKKVSQAIFQQHDVQYLSITLGEEGIALVDSHQKEYRVPTTTKEVFDVSGAGDTALAALTVAFCADKSPLEAAHFANLLSGIVVRKVGTATTTPEEILSYVASSSRTISGS